MVERLTASRRWVLRAGLATTASLLIPVPSVEAATVDPVEAATVTSDEEATTASIEAATIVSPYSGTIPMTFPVSYGNYRAYRDNWHEYRVGPSSRWSHRLSLTRRAHDGNDIFPANYSYMGLVYAPFQARVSAVCTYANGVPTYRVSRTTPPPWNYSQVFDGRVPRYGNFIWLRSTAANTSNGYFVFYCHLQNESTLRSLRDKLAVGEVTVYTSSKVGRIGDSGNAAGDPQLHLEIHYPIGNSFTCSRCVPTRSGLTAIDPYRSLRAARIRY